jgi:hypothetical protein
VYIDYSAVLKKENDRKDRYKWEYESTATTIVVTI